MNKALSIPEGASLFSPNPVLKKEGLACVCGGEDKKGRYGSPSRAKRRESVVYEYVEARNPAGTPLLAEQ
ncbi:hypothetical protein KKC97_01250, partial [bacterium]|nr:hypothetical protein [bacterium]